MIFQADLRQEFLGAGFLVCLAQASQSTHRQHDIVASRKLRQQEVKLKHKAETAEAQGGTPIFVEILCRLAIDKNITGCGHIEKAQEIHQ